VKYLREKQYYEDLYDLFTIKDCLLTVKTSKKVMKEKAKVGERSLDISVEGLENFLLYFKKGERYRDKADTIQKWKDKDSKLDDRLNTAIFPSYIPCEHCGMEIEEEDRHIEDILNHHSRVQFFAHCKNCEKVMIVYDNGDIYKPKLSLRPKCNSKLKRSSKYKDNISTIKETCTKCTYKDEIVIDHDKDDRQREAEKKKDQNLLEKYRSIYCLSEEEGSKYIQDMENLKRMIEMIKDSEEKKKDPHYQKAVKVKKLTSVALFKLLEKNFKNEKYESLSFGDPDMGRFVIIPFTVQDAKKSRKKEKSIQELRTLINKLLENTNWRLMSTGIDYRMGYLTGRLKGYEKEEELAKYLKKRDNKAQYFISNNGEKVIL
jgi:hypothetical protein